MLQAVTMKATNMLGEQSIPLLALVETDQPAARVWLDLFRQPAKVLLHGVTVLVADPGGM